MVGTVYFAIADLPLEITELLFLFVLAAVAPITARYIVRLHTALDKLKKELDDQSRFTARLNQVVDRMLKIDDHGDIDSNRHHPRS